MAPTAPEACNAELGCATITKGQTIKVGYSGPMTGDYSQFGIDMSSAMKLAVADFGDVQGWKVEMAIEDDGGGAEGGAAVANKLVSDPTFVAMAGPAFSGATAAAMPIYEKAGSIPMMSPSATNPDLTTKGSRFRPNAFTDTEQGIGAAKYLFEKLGIKKLALMHDGGDYGQGLAKVVEENFKSLGGEVVAFEAITPCELTITAPLAAVASSAPEALYFGGYNAEASVLVNQMEQAGLSAWCSSAVMASTARTSFPRSAPTARVCMLRPSSPPEPIPSSNSTKPTWLPPAPKPCAFRVHLELL